MAIKENALPVSQSIGSGDYLRKVSSGGVSQQVPFSEVKAAVVTVDPAIDSESENPVQNKAIAAAMDAAGTQTQQAIATAIQAEVTDRNSAISQAISTEVSNRNTAISDAVEAEAQAREAADEELNQSKANTDGNYPDMTVGNADQLISSIYTEDQTPYNFRQSGGGISIGDREIDKIVGGTIAWNQLVPTLDTFRAEGGVTMTYADGVATISSTTARNGIYAPLSYRKGNKYLFTCDLKATSAYSVVIGATSAAYVGKTVPGDNQWHTIVGIGNSLASYNANAYIFATTTYENLQVRNYNIFDLTAMFGSAIADYIYSLEQATAGAGVAYFRKLFPKPYYAYNAGELMSVQAASHEMVGFNQWDEEWELGDISASTGENTSSTSVIRTKNYIPVLPKTVYFAKFGTATGYAVMARFYDADKNFIGTSAYGGTQVQYNQPFTTPENARYMRFTPQPAYGTTYKNDICINLSHNGSRNGEYAPYEKHSYELDANLTLRGIPKLDASNNLYYDGDTYASDGTVTRKYKKIDLGTLDWTNYKTGGFKADALPDAVTLTTETSGAICAKYVRRASSVTLSSGEFSIAGRSIYIVDSAFTTDTTAFKQAMSGVELVYELATPTTETATVYTNPQTVSDWGTEEYVDAAVQEGDRDVAVPVGHVTDYLANLRDKLQNLPDAANADGTYLVQQTSGQMALLAYTPGVNIPAAPTTDGTYTLQAVVSGGVATYSWVSN